MPAPLKTFIIYARADQDHKDLLLKHLTPLVRSEVLSVWHDGDIQPGEVWEKAIKENIKSSDLILILVSIHSINSEFIQREELTLALKQVQEGVSRVVPIIVDPCAWNFHPVFKGLQGLPEDMRPVSTWPNINAAWHNVVSKLHEMAAAKMEAAEQLEQQKIAQKEKAERERLARIAAEKAERERLEREAAAKKAADEKAERNRLARIAAEKNAQAEKEERDRLAQIKAAQVEQDRLAKEAADKKAQAERAERERLARIAAEQQAAAEKAKQQLLEKEKPLLSTPGGMSLSGSQSAAGQVTNFNQPSTPAVAEQPPKKYNGISLVFGFIGGYLFYTLIELINYSLRFKYFLDYNYNGSFWNVMYKLTILPSLLISVGAVVSIYFIRKKSEYPRAVTWTGLFVGLIVIMELIYPSYNFYAEKLGLISKNNSTTSVQKSAVPEDASKTNMVSSSELLVDIQELITSTKFDSTEAKQAIDASIKQKVSVTSLTQYYLLCKWVQKANAVISGTGRFDKTEIVTNLRYVLTDPKFSFLTNEQKKDIQFYKDIVDYMNGYSISNADGVMKKMKTSHTSAKRKEVGDFLLRKGLWNGL